MGNLNFDSSAVEPTTMGFEPLPAGWYRLKVVNSEVKETKSGTGQYLKIEFDVYNATTANPLNRKHWEMFNLWNANEKAQQIARGQFSALCRACGKIGLVKDSSELHGKTLEAKFRVVPASGDYEAKNGVNEYRAIERPKVIDSSDAPPF